MKFVNLKYILKTKLLKNKGWQKKDPIKTIDEKEIIIAKSKTKKKLQKHKA